MASERPLPPQPSTDDDHDGPRMDGPSDPASVTAPPAPISQEGDLFGPSESGPRLQSDHGDIPSNYFPLLSSSAGPTSPTSIRRYDEESPRRTAPEFMRNQPNLNIGTNLPIPPPSARFVEPLVPPTPRRRGTRDTRASTIDYIVPVVEGDASTLKQRLEPTLKAARDERAKYANRAKWTGWILNAAIGLQVLLGSLTTGLSAAATNGRSAAVQTTILGALSTIVASYLARARGSNEPELSTTRVKDLDRFIRDCEALELDHGSDTTNNFDHQLIDKREELERILGSKTEGTSRKPGENVEKNKKQVEKPSSGPELKLAAAV